MTDLWADFTPPDDVKAPVHLLREQAAVLANKTKGIVGAYISSAPAADGKFWVGFDLESPNLPRYSYRLLELTYPLEFYPLNLVAFSTPQTAANEAEFQTILRSVLQDKRTKQVVEAIMVQALALKGA